MRGVALRGDRGELFVGAEVIEVEHTREAPHEAGSGRFEVGKAAVRPAPAVSTSGSVTSATAWLVAPTGTGSGKQRRVCRVGRVAAHRAGVGLVYPGHGTRCTDVDLLETRVVGVQ